jgi:hypothetical protein
MDFTILKWVAIGIYLSMGVLFSVVLGREGLSKKTGYIACGLIAISLAQWAVWGPAQAGLLLVFSVYWVASVLSAIWLVFPAVKEPLWFSVLCASVLTAMLASAVFDMENTWFFGFLGAYIGTVIVQVFLVKKAGHSS